MILRTNRRMQKRGEHFDFSYKESQICAPRKIIHPLESQLRTSDHLTKREGPGVSCKK